MDCIVLSDSFVDVLSLREPAFGKNVFRRVLGLREVIKVGP